MNKLIIIILALVFCGAVIAQITDEDVAKEEAALELSGPQIVKLFTEQAQVYFEEYVANMRAVEEPYFHSETKAVGRAAWAAALSSTPTEVPSGIPAKYHYFYEIICEKPIHHSFDVQKTTSLVSPYIAYMDIPVTLTLQAITVKTKRKGMCDGKLPQKCIEELSGKILKTDTYSSKIKDILKREKTEVRVNYAFQGGEWVRKGEDYNPVDRLILIIEEGLFIVDSAGNLTIK